jgi:hypothetical protein
LAIIERRREVARSNDPEFAERASRMSTTSKTLAVTFIGMCALTIAIPHFLRSCACGAEESSAVAQLRTVNTAEVMYLSAHEGKYATIAELIKDGLLDERFAGELSGYRFNVTPSEGRTDYAATATPGSKQAGIYGYYSTSDAVIRYAMAKGATCEPCFPEGQSGKPVQ